MSEDREPTLEELAFQMGQYSLACRQYIRLAHAVRMWRECRWWEVWRRHNIKKILIDTIEEMEKMK